MFSGMLSEYLGECDPSIDLFCLASGGTTPIDTSTPAYQGQYDLPGYTPGGGGYGGGGTTITPAGTSADSWTSVAKAFPSIASGLATIFTSARGGTYTIGPQGQISSGYGAYNPQAGSALGVTGGISTTTLLLIGLALVFFMKK